MIMQQENETQDNTKGQIRDNKKAAQEDSEIEHKNTNNQNYSSIRNQQNPGQEKLRLKIMTGKKKEIQSRTLSKMEIQLYPTAAATCRTNSGTI